MTTPTRRSPRKSTTTPDNVLYGDLPKAVTDAATRINLPPAKSSDVKRFMKETLGEETVDSLKYQVYRIKEAKTKLKTIKGRKKFRKVSAKPKRPNKPAKKRLTSKERRTLFDVKHVQDIKYKTFHGLHQMWKSYFQTLTSTPKVDLLKIIRADFHGAEFVITSSTNPSLVGQEGIVIQETKNTFNIVARDNRVLTIPKKGTTFTVKSGQRIFDLNGSQLAMTSHQRSRMKPKMRTNIRKSDL